MSRCSAKNRLGCRCRVHTLPGSSFCFWHDPARAPARNAASRRGGLHKRGHRAAASFAASDLKTPEGLLTFSADLIRATSRLRNSVHRARALGYLMLAQNKLLDSGEFTARLDAFQSLLDQLEERVKSVEEMLDQRSKPRTKDQIGRLPDNFAVSLEDYSDAIQAESYGRDTDAWKRLEKKYGFLTLSQVTGLIMGDLPIKPKTQDNGGTPSR